MPGGGSCAVPIRTAALVRQRFLLFLFKKTHKLPRTYNGQNLRYREKIQTYEGIEILPGQVWLTERCTRLVPRHLERTGSDGAVPGNSLFDRHSQQTHKNLLIYYNLNGEILYGMKNMLIIIFQEYYLTPG